MQDCQGLRDNIFALLQKEKKNSMSKILACSFDPKTKMIGRIEEDLISNNWKSDFDLLQLKIPLNSP